MIFPLNLKTGKPDTRGMTRQQILDKAHLAYSYVSCMTNHYTHGWLLGILHRNENFDFSFKYAGEFLEGYCDGWLLMDSLMM